MTESLLTREILLAASKRGHRLFRLNTAKAWVGQVVSQTPEALTLKHPRVLHAGLVVGGSDIIGWTKEGLFAALEVKAPRGRATSEQLSFLSAVQAAGGRAGIVRSVEDAIAVLEGMAEKS